MDKYIWLIPVLPLAGFIINGVGRKALSEKLIGFIGSFLVLVAFGLKCCYIFADQINRRSLSMLLILTGLMQVDYTYPICVPN